MRAPLTFLNFRGLDAQKRDSFRYARYNGLYFLIIWEIPLCLRTLHYSTTYVIRKS